MASFNSYFSVMVCNFEQTAKNYLVNVNAANLPVHWEVDAGLIRYGRAVPLLSARWGFTPIFHWQQE